MTDPKNEAKLIVNALFDDYGTGGYTRGECPYIDGKKAITEMRTDNYPGWQEVEWAGYHLKYLIQKECELKLNDQITPHNIEKRYLVKGNFIWDSRFHAGDSFKIILGDIDEYSAIVRDSGGIGILVFDSVASNDLNEDFRRWHEEFKGGPSSYTLEREREGRPIRIRKTGYMIRKVLAYYFTMEDINKGLNEGWVGGNFQGGMRNANGSPRNNKFFLKCNSIPSEYLLFVKNFNEDPEEFGEEFPEFT
jgi:hypothetical protein